MTRRQAISFSIALLLGLLIFFASTCNGQCLEMDIVILGDFSGSVGGHEQFVLDAIDRVTQAEEMKSDCSVMEMKKPLFTQGLECSRIFPIGQR